MRFRPAPFVLQTALVALAAPALDEPSFQVDTPEIQARGSATLRWQWSPATRGYLSSLGLVDHPSGDSVSVSPDETTSYVLILEAPDQSPRVLTRRVVVRGAKGSSGYWPSDPFAPLAYEVDYDMHSKSLAAVSARIRSVLRDDRGLEIRQFSQQEGQITFYTAFLQNAQLNQPDERPRRFRRIAYRVRLAAGKPDLIHVNISSTIEWRLVVDTRWFLENSSASNRYQTQTTDLWRAFRGN
jgi:hypothetical protein